MTRTELVKLGIDGDYIGIHATTAGAILVIGKQLHGDAEQIDYTRSLNPRQCVELAMLLAESAQKAWGSSL